MLQVRVLSNQSQIQLLTSVNQTSFLGNLTTYVVHLKITGGSGKQELWKIQYEAVRLIT